MVAIKLERNVSQCAEPVRVVDQNILDVVVIPRDCQTVVVCGRQAEVDNGIVIADDNRLRSLAWLWAVAVVDRYDRVQHASVTDACTSWIDTNYADQTQNRRRPHICYRVPNLQLS